MNSKILLLKKNQKRYKLLVSYVHRKFASLVAQAKRFNNMTPQAITADVETNPKQAHIYQQQRYHRENSIIFFPFDKKAVLNSSLRD